MTKLSDPLPRPVAWITRTIGWGLGILIIVAILYGYGYFRLFLHTEACLGAPSPPRQEKPFALVSTQRLVACLDQRAGILESVLLYSTKKTVMSLPRTPCRYIGTWTASRTGSVYKVTLKDDSQFVADPIRTTAPGAEVITGSWGVNHDKMVWLYDSGRVWPPDINRIKDASDDAFTLVEEDRTTTRYALLARTDSSACSP